MADVTKELFDFHFLTAAGEHLVVELGAESAKGWMTTHADALRDVVWVGLFPKQGNPTTPALYPLIVDIPEGCHYVYYRRVQGVIVGGVMKPPSSVTYVIGWTDGLTEWVVELPYAAGRREHLHMLRRERSNGHGSHD
jgi:hypothetical protein